MVSNILVSSSMSVSASVAKYNLSTSLTKNATIKDAIDIGNLDAQGTVISISDKGEAGTSAVSKSFVAKDGAISLSQSISSYVNLMYTRFQLSDGSGNIIADSGGTAEQQATYQKWKEGTLYITAGTYTVTATPDPDYTGQIGLTVQSKEQQGTTLEVKSTLTGNNTSAFYSFSLSGTNIKFDLDSKDSNSIRVRLYNSKGALVADSNGNPQQRAKYLAMTSGTGLSASSGDYTVEITYKNGVDTAKDLGYKFNLYSGNTYSVVYTSNVKAVPYDPTATGSMTATSDALLFEKNAYNKIITSAAQAINIGWLQQDKSMLDVYSMLTSANHTNFYSFTLQQGENLKFDFNTKSTTNPSAFRVQLLDSSGLRVIADSAGTREQREAFERLTSQTGINAGAGVYVVKITYADGVPRNDQKYEFGIYSGSVYEAQYKTIASAQTFMNAMLAGELGNSMARSAGIAAYLTAQANEDEDFFASNLANALRLKF